MNELTPAGIDAAGPRPWRARRMSIVISSKIERRGMHESYLNMMHLCGLTLCEPTRKPEYSHAHAPENERVLAAEEVREPTHQQE